MIGRLFIDGNDAYTTYGVCVEEHGWNDLIAFPPLKSYEYNDWQEEDGIEADLDNPVLNTKEAQLNIVISGDFSLFLELIDALSDGAYHTFNGASIGRTYRLRLTQQPNMDYARLLSKATLKLADDFPLRNYSYLAPQSTLSSPYAFEIDDIDNTVYGIMVLRGTLADVLRVGQVKQNLTRNISTQAGLEYDNSNVVFKAKDVKLQCLMRADNLTQLWRNWDAMLYNLVRPGERTMYINDVVQEFPICYKSCQVQEFYPDGKPWLKFALTITCLHDFRISADAILAAEDGTVVFTEDGQDAIDMNINE